MSDQAKVQLPRWRCHKEVWADKIDAVYGEPGAKMMRLAGGGVVPISDALWSRLPAATGYSEIPGGYYVRYADGYESWSPAKAFEEGYTRI